MTKRPPVSEIAFINAWHASKTIDEVIRLTGLLKQTVQSRSSLLRSQGIDLPYLKSAGVVVEEVRQEQVEDRIATYLVEQISDTVLLNELKRRKICPPS